MSIDVKKLSLSRVLNKAREIFTPIAQRNIPLVQSMNMASIAVNTPLNVNLEPFRGAYNSVNRALKQPVGQFGQSIVNTSNKLVNSPLGIPGRAVMGYGDSLRENINRAGQAYEQNTQLLNEGAPLKARIKPLAMGGWNTAKALAQVTPIGALKPTVGMALPGAFNAGVAKLQGQDPARAFGRGVAEYQGWRPILNVTDPVISKVASKVSAGGRGLSRLGKLSPQQLVTSQVATRGATGIGNVIEDEILARLDQRKITNKDRAISFSMGAAMGGNEELLKQADFTDIAKKLKVPVKQVQEVYEGSLARKITVTDKNGKTSVGITDKRGSGEWIKWATDNGYDYKIELTGGSLGSVGGGQKPPDPTEALKVEDYVLPKDIPVYQEAKAIGAKRIAPDRIPQQQLTPDAGIKALVDKQKQRLQNNANSWATATKKIDDLIKKYGEKLPQRTEKNIQTYPGLMDDYRTYQEYKKYAWQPKNLTDVKTQFERRANVTNAQWTPEAEAKALESAKKDYIELIKSDISKGYKYPDSVLDFDRSFRIAENNRARYEKGLRTSFSSDDQRIVIEDIDKIGGGMKRQDGKPITDSQKETIKKGVVDFANTMGIDIARLAKDDRWVYVHLNGKNPFLTAMAGGLYRKGANNVSISVSGSETFKKVVDGKEVFDRVHTTMAHELGHALDGKADKRLFDSQTIWSLRNNFNPIEWMPRGDKYWKSQSEITARMIEQYNAVKKGNTNLFDREGYWKKDVYEQIIEPAVERAINTHFAKYKLQTPLELPKSQLTDLYNQSQLPKTDIAQALETESSIRDNVNKIQQDFLDGKITMDQRKMLAEKEFARSISQLPKSGVQKPTIGDIQVDSQQFSGEKLLADFDEAINSKNYTKAKQIGDEIMANDSYETFRSSIKMVLDKLPTRVKIKTKQVKTPQLNTLVETGLQTKSDSLSSPLVQTKPLLELQTSQKVRIKQPQIDQTLDSIIADGRKSIGESQKDTKPLKQVLSNLYTQWVDRYHPIVKASTQAKNKLKTQSAVLRPEYDPEYLVRRLTGAGGIADYRFQTELKPVIQQIDNAGISKIDIDTYLAHNRMAGFGDVGREIVGSNPAKSKQIVSALETKYPQIKDIASKLYGYQDKGLRELVDAGFISEDSLKVMRSQNPNYAPLYRVMDEMNDYLGLPTRKTMQGTNPVLKIKGSNRQIDSPLESIIGNTFKQRAAIEKNRIAQSIIGLQQFDDLGFKKVAKSGNDTITVWSNGKKEYWQVGSDIADTAKGVNEESMNTLLKIFQAPARLLRQGATGRNPEFMIPNIVRDQLDAGITSRYGYIPFVDYVSGLKSMISNDDVYQRWQRSGAKIDLGELSGRKSINQMFDEKTTKRGLFKWMTDSLDVLGKYSEQPTRVGLFKKAYQKTGNELLAAMESRDATVDFARMGSKMKVANSIIPFLNVGVQGFDKLIRSIKNNPAKVAINMGIYAAVPAITTTLYNIMNYPEEYAEIPQYEKDANFVIVTGRTRDGNVDYVTIPKGNVLPVVANPIQSFLEFTSNTNTQTFGELATSLLSTTLPVIGDGQSPKEVAVKTIGSNLPQAVKPITENLLNKSFYKYDTKKEDTKEIVPYYLKDKPAYQQSYEWTPQMYQKIGAMFNVSPLQVQNLMEGYLAGYAKIPANIIENLNDVSKGESIPENEKMILRRFIKNTYPSSSSKPKYEQPVPSMMDRLTGKASASDGSQQETNVDIIKQKLEVRPELATPQEIAIYYESRVTQPKSISAYESAVYENDIWKQVSNINSRESLTQTQKDEASMALLSNIGVTPEDYKYHVVAKQDNDIKSLYAEEEITKLIASGVSREEIDQWLVDNRKEVDGKQVLTSGVIDYLVDQNILSYSQGKDLKSIKVSGSGAKKSVTKKSSKVKKPKKISFKAIKPPKVKIVKSTASSYFKAPKIKRVRIKKAKKLKFR